MTKYTVIRDELKLKGGGLYCFMPFEKLDSNGRAVFKIGLALDLSHRTENYHTYFPLGVYMVAFLNEIPARKYLRSMKKDMSTKELYLEIEKFIFNTIIKNGGKRLHTTARVKNQNNKMEGETEWVYCSVDDIHNAFSEAQVKFGGDVNTFDLKSINATAQQSMNSRKKKYIGEIIYFL